MRGTSTERRGLSEAQRSELTGSLGPPQAPPRDSAQNPSILAAQQQDRHQPIFTFTVILLPQPRLEVKGRPSQPSCTQGRTRTQVCLIPWKGSFYQRVEVREERVSSRRGEGVPGTVRPWIRCCGRRDSGKG